MAYEMHWRDEHSGRSMCCWVSVSFSWCAAESRFSRLVRCWCVSILFKRINDGANNTKSHRRKTSNLAHGNKLILNEFWWRSRANTFRDSCANIAPMCRNSCVNIVPMCRDSCDNIVPMCRDSCINIVAMCRNSCANIVPMCRDSCDNIVPMCRDSCANIVPMCRDSCASIVPICRDSCANIVPMCRDSCVYM